MAVAMQLLLESARVLPSSDWLPLLLGHLDINRQLYEAAGRAQGYASAERGSALVRVHVRAPCRSRCVRCTLLCALAVVWKHATHSEHWQRSRGEG